MVLIMDREMRAQVVPSALVLDGSILKLEDSVDFEALLLMCCIDLATCKRALAFHYSEGRASHLTGRDWHGEEENRNK